MSDLIEISVPAIGEEEWHAIREPLRTGWLTQGPQVKAFEDAFASRHGVDHALATTSCTTALHLMLLAAGIGPGDEVILPSFTWVSTANAVLYCGATPVLADVDPDTYNLDINDVLARVSTRTKAVIAVHLFGLCVDVLELQRALPERVRVFEDAACAAGASVRGNSAGSMGDAAAFSFHPRKSITTGEGGMITTSIAEVADRASQLRNHGLRPLQGHDSRNAAPVILPDVDMLGFNYRMTDLQGAIGLVQLSKLDRFIEERSRGAAIYTEELKSCAGIQMPHVPSFTRHAWQAFVIRVLGADGLERRNSMMKALFEMGISTRPGTHAVHTLDFYRRALQLSDADLPGSALCRDTTLAIPLHNKMTESDFARVIEAVRGIAN